MKNTLLILTLLFSLLFSCTDNGIIYRSKSISIKHSSCKTFYRSAGLDSVDREKDMIEYYYDSLTKILKIKHYTAAFNCCVKSTDGEIYLDTILIKVAESEKTPSPCDCSCLYDLTYEIDHVEPQKYLLEISEPYLVPPDEALKFTIDLSAKSYDTLFKMRTAYPWAE